MFQAPKNTVDRWNLFEKDSKVPPDQLVFELNLSGELARKLENEASRRGITYAQMAEILIEQGLYFWSAKQ